MNKKLINILPILLVTLIQSCFLSCSKENSVTPTLKISSIIPETGPKATNVILAGEGFNLKPNENIVTLNGKVCSVVNASATQLTVIIPSNAGSGAIQVVTNGSKAFSTKPFTYVYTTTVTTFAGSTQGFINSTGTSAKFSYPKGVTIDLAGNLYITDSGNNKIRKITSDGIVSTLAGSTTGFTDGEGSIAQFDGLVGLTLDVAGNLYVSDLGNNKIRKVNSVGVVSTVAGSIQGFLDGTAATAQFTGPGGVAVDAAGNIYVADLYNHKIRKITQEGVVSTLAGSTQGYSNGTGTAAQFDTPSGLAIDGNGNLYVTDIGNQKIRKVTPTGVVSTIKDGNGIDIQFNAPSGLAIDSGGNLFVTDNVNNKIRKITSGGVVTIVAGGAGGGIPGFADGSGEIAKFNGPRGIIVDTSGNLFVSDYGNHKIRKIIID